MNNGFGSDGPIDIEALRRQLAQAFGQHGTARTFGRNDFLFKEGDEPDGVYLITGGLIKMMQSTAEGRNITFFLRKKDDLIGVSEALLGTKRRRSAQCLLDSSVCFIRASAFRDLVQAEPGLSIVLLTKLASTFLDAMSVISHLAAKPVPWRIMWLLMHLEVRSEAPSHTVHLPLNHEEMAYIVGCSRQTVTKVLNGWRRDGLADYTRTELRIYDPERFFAGIGHSGELVT